MWAKISAAFKKFGLVVGSIISTVFLIVFYYTIFGIYAILVGGIRSFEKPVRGTIWHSAEVAKYSLKDFVREF